MTKIEQQHKQISNEKATQLTNCFPKEETYGGCYRVRPHRKGSSKIFREYLRLKRPRDYTNIPGIKGKSISNSEVIRLAKREGIRSDNIEWFVNMVNIGTYNIPDFQKQYQSGKTNNKSLTIKG